ncbi:MAG: hypothetical protein CVU29_04310 [Betaproteobacteria bacterium HGW-Betaproteobacteria-22]|nr:MAG: hypothetical protein CVU29_04310 [Betaproteobacteria bacterium HGW-Betaproteobacteria-22]
MSYTGAYGYAAGDLLENRNTYFYTKFSGQAFLTAWYTQRNQVKVAEQEISVASESVLDASPTMQMIEVLYQKLSAHHVGDQTIRTLNKLVQRFEVSKRLHGRYNANWRAVDAGEYKSWVRYVRFAEVLSLAYDSTHSLSYLNALLKIMDTLTAALGQLDVSLRDRVVNLTVCERDYVDALWLKLDKRFEQLNTDVASDAALAQEGHRTPVRLKGIVLLAAQTARSQAYIQALVANGLYPEKVILLGETPVPDERNAPDKSWNDILLPNLAETITQTCNRANIETIHCGSVDVNSEECARCMLDVKPLVVIYSGVGGQIVSEQTLALSPKFLHMHSGWLPQYRGSTTLYYALLNKDSPGVTALLLDRTIDTGPVIAQKHYPAPSFDLDIDRVYDSAIRANLLVEVIRNYVRSGAFSVLMEQNPEDGDVYYVIHPVLKHLAILSLKKEHAS